MFLRIPTKKSTKNYSDEIIRLKEKLDKADAVVIGAGAGLSTAAGFTYAGERFKQYFSDFKQKYGFTGMYSGGFYSFETLEEYWAYWSRYIYINRYMDIPNNLYDMILSLVNGKDYFVITTNVDHCFQKACFDQKRLFYTQVDYGLLQCPTPCCNETFDNEDIIKRMYKSQSNMKIPTELIPLCPHCKKPLTTNLRCDNSFVQDEGWHNAAERYDNFLRTRKGQNIVFLELGVGYNTPAIIKYPFWRIVSGNKNSIYVCINKCESVCPEEIEKQSICIDEDIYKVIKDIKEVI